MLPLLSIILFVVFLGVGFYSLKFAGTSTSPRIVYLAVAIVFLIAAIIVGLGMAGIVIF